MYSISQIYFSCIHFVHVEGHVSLLFHALFSVKTEEEKHAVMSMSFVFVSCLVGQIKLSFGPRVARGWMSVTPDLRRLQYLQRICGPLITHVSPD